jgi:hypothetical protein
MNSNTQQQIYNKQQLKPPQFPEKKLNYTMS